MSRNLPSFGKSLFFGDLREELIFPFPRLHREEQARTSKLVEQLHEFARQQIDANAIDRDERIPESVLAGLRPLGLFGVNIPTAYGGLGLGAGATCRVFDALGAIDGSLAVTLGTHAALAAKALTVFGSDDQRRRYLPKLASGETIASFAVTEPVAGSDAASIRMRAEPQPDGQGFLLNGSKSWVTNGGLAGLHVLFAQTQVARTAGEVDRISGFLLDPGPGVIVGSERRKLGVRGSSTTALYIEEVRASGAQLLGGLGGGFKVLMETINFGRLAFAAVCLGTTRTLLRLAVQHATSRHQFGRLLSTLGMIKEKCASMAVDLYAAESVVYLTAGLLDASSQGRPIDTSLETACAKVLSSEMLWRAATDASQVAAGCGYANDYPYERLLRDARLYSLYPGGTNEVLRCYIALNGLAGPGEQLARLSDAIKFPLRGYGLVVETLVEKVRTAAYGRAILARHHPRLKREAVLIEDTIESLTREVDRVLRRHGRFIAEMQYVQSRVANVVIDLYAMCASVSRASAALYQKDARGDHAMPEAGGELDRAERELRLCIGFCSRASTRITETLARFTQNDDELMKSIADDCYIGQPYPFDGVL
ncbi:MAG: acyl-CoA dehydrogenase family protein [Myxococcales bacterium]|nr:acyl-CoA dehydrogenase family protein [Myxococcales bacterium]